MTWSRTFKLDGSDDAAIEDFVKTNITHPMTDHTKQSLAGGGNMTKSKDEKIARLQRELNTAVKRVKRLEKLDREAATHVESLICMRTGFTGNPPYVGWKGLGLALKEKLDQLQSELAALKKAGTFNEGQASALRWAASYAYSDQAKVEILIAADNAERGEFDTRPTTQPEKDESR